MSIDTPNGVNLNMEAEALRVANMTGMEPLAVQAIMYPTQQKAEPIQETGDQDVEKIEGKILPCAATWDEWKRLLYLNNCNAIVRTQSAKVTDHDILLTRKHIQNLFGEDRFRTMLKKHEYDVSFMPTIQEKKIRPIPERATFSEWLTMMKISRRKLEKQFSFVGPILDQAILTREEMYGFLRKFFVRRLKRASFDVSAIVTREFMRFDEMGNVVQNEQNNGSQPTSEQIVTAGKIPSANSIPRVSAVAARNNDFPSLEKKTLSQVPDFLNINQWAALLGLLTAYLYGKGYNTYADEHGNCNQKDMYACLGEQFIQLLKRKGYDIGPLKKFRLPRVPVLPKQKQSSVESFQHEQSQTLFDSLKEQTQDEFEPSFDTATFEPTTAYAGSEEKIAILAWRVQNGFPLWHRDDRIDFEGLLGAIPPIHPD